MQRIIITSFVLTFALIALPACQRGDRIERRYEEQTVTTETVSPDTRERGGVDSHREDGVTREEHRSEPRIIIE